MEQQINKKEFREILIIKLIDYGILNSKQDLKHKANQNVFNNVLTESYNKILNNEKISKNMLLDIVKNNI